MLDLAKKGPPSTENASKGAARCAMALALQSRTGQRSHRAVKTAGVRGRSRPSGEKEESLTAKRGESSTTSKPDARTTPPDDDKEERRAAGKTPGEASQADAGRDGARACCAAAIESGANRGGGGKGGSGTDGGGNHCLAHSFLVACPIDGTLILSSRR